MDRKALSAQIKSCAGNKLFPGGMSAQKFYATSRAQGMDITLEQAKELRDVWVRTFREMELHSKPEEIRQ